jgi:hypothetical protein
MDRQHALSILVDARERSSREVVGDADVWEALDYFAAQGIERDTLEWFWSSCFAANDIGRHQNINAALNRVLVLLSGRGSPRGR